MSSPSGVVILVAASLASVVALATPASAQTQPNLSTRVSNFSIQSNVFFNSSSADVLDGCIAPGGPYKLLRFDFRSRNDGNADFVAGVPPPAGQSNDVFVWSPAHSHHHVRDFNVYSMMNDGGRTVVWGLKQAFCLMDLEQHGSPAGSRKYTCSNQGLTWGWTDVYSSGLPCQFIDITGLPNGTYNLIATTNASLVVSEADPYDNTTNVRLTVSGDAVTAAASGWRSSVEVLPANGGNPPSAAVVARQPNQYDLFYLNPSDGMIYTKWQDPSGNWFPDGEGLLLDGPFAGSAPAVASWDRQRLDVVARAGNTSVTHWAWAGGWSFDSLPLPAGAAPAIVAPAKNRLLVAAVGADHTMGYQYWNGSSWSGATLGGNFVLEAPALTSSGSGVVHLFARTTGANSVSYNRFTEGSGWSDWQDLGGVATSDLSAASWNVNRVDLVTRGTDNGLWRNVWNGSAWSGWVRDTAGPLASAPRIISTAANRLDVFYYQIAGSTVFYRRRNWNGSSWVQENPSAASGITTSVPLLVASWGDPQFGLFHTLSTGAIRVRNYR